VRTSALARVATWVVALAVGVAYGLAGTIAHTYAFGWFPLGLVLAIIGSGALLLAVRLLTSDRWAALATGLGMMIAMLVFSGRGPGGSVIVPKAAEGQFDPGMDDHGAAHGGARRRVAGRLEVPAVELDWDRDVCDRASLCGPQGPCVHRRVPCRLHLRG
jgi:hypothetical protein